MKWFPVGLAIALAGCARARPAVEFVGRPSVPVVSTDGVEETEALPRGTERLGRLFARCRAFEAREAFEERPLIDVDCSERRLRLWLRQAASERGGDVLADVRCRDGHTSDCSAILARRDEGARARSSIGATKTFSDVSGGHGAQIWVSYVPIREGFDRPLRDPQRVDELPSLPLSHFVVGTLETLCEGCNEDALRQAMRVTAGRIGASDLISVRCMAGAEADRCVGEAAAPFEVEP